MVSVLVVPIVYAIRVTPPSLYVMFAPSASKIISPEMSNVKFPVRETVPSVAKSYSVTPASLNVTLPPSASRIISPDASTVYVVVSILVAPVEVRVVSPDTSISKLEEISRSRIPVTPTVLVVPNVNAIRLTESSRKLMLDPPASKLISPTASTLKFAPTLNCTSVPLA